MAVELYDQGKIDESLKVLDQAIANYPDSSLSYGNKMMILKTERKFDELSRLFDLMIRRNVNHQTAYAYKGILYELNSRRDSAFILYKLGYEVAKELNVPEEQKEMDYISYLRMVSKASLAQIELNKVRAKYPSNPFVESFGQILDSVDILKYKKQLVNAY